MRRAFGSLILLGALLALGCGGQPSTADDWEGEDEGEFPAHDDVGDLEQDYSNSDDFEHQEFERTDFEDQEARGDDEFPGHDDDESAEHWNKDEEPPVDEETAVEEAEPEAEPEPSEAEEPSDWHAPHDDE